MKMIKQVLATLIAALFLSGAFANSFTVYGGAADISLVPAPAAALVAGAEVGFSVAPSVDLLVGAGYDFGSVVALYTGVAVDLPTREAADATLYFAARAGVTADFANNFDMGFLGAGTLGIRGDNGLIVEGGVLAQTTGFDFNTLTLVPVVLVGYGFQF